MNHQFKNDIVRLLNEEDRKSYEAALALTEAGHCSPKQLKALAVLAWGGMVKAKSLQQNPGLLPRLIGLWRIARLPNGIDAFVEIMDLIKS